MIKKIASILSLLVCFGTGYTQAKIYDCFLFFNELELLEIRFQELYDHVDKFVLVEACETFRGTKKPLFFEQNKHLFQKYSDKIIHVIVDDHFECFSAWDRETYHRNQIMRGLKNCQPDDIIFISDVDEIMRPEKIESIVKQLATIPANQFKMILLRQTLYRYFFNRLDSKDNPWPGTVALYYKDLLKASPEYCRRIRQDVPQVMYDAGWHFTYMGGYQRVVTKLSSFSHAE